MSDALLSALREIGRALNAALDLTSTLTLMTRVTTEVMGVDSCSIYLVEGDELVLRATTGLDRRAVGRARLGAGEGLTGWAVAHNRPVAAREAARDPRFKLLPETGEERFRSLLAVPLQVQGRTIGAINVQTCAPRDFSEAEVEFLALIADLAAGALEKAQLYERMRRQIRELSALARAAQLAAIPPHPERIAQGLLETALEALRADAASLHLLDAEEKTLLPLAAVGFEAPLPRLPAQEDPLGAGLEGIHTFLPLGTGPETTPPMAALLVVPLRVRDRSLGVLAAWRREPRAFEEGEETLAAALAGQAALALENARLWSRTAVVREMHHRVKNNLQTVAMLVRLQMEEAKAGPARAVLEETMHRILSIAAVHDLLARAEGLEVVRLRPLLERLIRTFSEAAPHVRFRVAGEDAVLAAQTAGALALAVNELLQNALDHAFPNGRSGAVEVRIGRREDGLELQVRDDGRGMPPDWSPNLGVQIVRTLVEEDLGGQVSFRPGPEGGTVARLWIPGIDGKGADGADPDRRR